MQRSVPQGWPPCTPGPDSDGLRWDSACGQEKPGRGEVSVWNTGSFSGFRPRLRVTFLSSGHSSSLCPLLRACSLFHSGAPAS